jgi:hypothetical protein
MNPTNATNATNSLADAARAVTRPIITVLFAAALVAMALDGQDPPAWLLSVAIPCILWWFGERFVMHRRNGP